MTGLREIERVERKVGNVSEDNLIDEIKVTVQYYSIFMFNNG